MAMRERTNYKRMHRESTILLTLLPLLCAASRCVCVCASALRLSLIQRTMNEIYLIAAASSTDDHWPFAVVSIRWLSLAFRLRLLLFDNWEFTGNTVSSEKKTTTHTLAISARARASSHTCMNAQWSPTQPRITLL